ncbi:hypothetical protein BROC_02412 [Candidatus Brocadiaceae bacterium]|nr:hypothetical protein BROC_02412 [Candidatus Brocadiaceae bacterium]
MMSDTHDSLNQETVTENLLATVKPFLLSIAGLALVLGILVLLPMFLTYLSEGDVRPPSQIHSADPAGKSGKTIYVPQKS